MTGLWLRDKGIWADVNPSTAPPPPPPPTDPTLPTPTAFRFWGTTSPNNVGINWDTAVVDTTDRLTIAMTNQATSPFPYMAINDSGVKVYFTDNSTAGRLTFTCTVYNPGTYTNIVCPTGAQPSNSGSDDPIGLVQPDGSYLTLFSGSNSSGGVITWSGNNGTMKGEGYIKHANYKTATGWPVGTFSSYTKAGFMACGGDVMSGAITLGDKQAVLGGGGIAHALNFLFNNNGLANTPWYPATRQDGASQAPYTTYPSGNTYYHQGTLLAIVPVSKGGPTRPGGWSAWENALVNALINYGGYVTDRTGGMATRVNPVPEPGVTATWQTSDFSSWQSLSTGTVGKFIFDNLRIITHGKPSITNHA